MDTSPEYIKQCQKAVKIQESVKKPTTGRYVYLETDEKFCVDEYDRLWLADEKACIFRQDQLQEIAGEDLTKSETTLFNRFYLWKMNEYPKTHQASWEQLWLAFVMNERFEKVWDNESEDWVTTE